MNWKELYDRQSPALFSFLLARGCPADQAEDLIQEVFLAAFSAGTRILHPRAYLFRAAGNALARSPRPEAGNQDPAKIVDPALGGADRAEEINRALARLPMEQREVVVLRIWHELRFREIAEALQRSKDTVASQWRYGIAKLKNLLEATEE